MPRNPHKARCSVPGCRNWAMRGNARCRSHRDAELGPRGAGAPPGNLNALVHGRYSHPLSPPDLERLVAAAVDQPADLPLQIGIALRSIQARAADPLLALLALRRLLAQLTSRVAARLFSVELHAYLHACLAQRNPDPAALHAEADRDESCAGSPGAPRDSEAGSLPPPLSDRLEAVIERCASQDDLQAWLCWLRKMVKREKQLPEPGSGA